MPRDEGTVLLPRACTCTCLFATSSATKNWGQPVRVLPEGCISVCRMGSSQSGVGKAGLGIAGCPLPSVLPLRRGSFSFLLAAAEPLAYLCNLKKTLVLGKRATWTIQGWEYLGSTQSWSWCRASAVVGSAKDQSLCHCFTSSCYCNYAFHSAEDVQSPVWPSDPTGWP